MNNALETQESIPLAQAVYPSLQRWVDGFYVAKRSQRIAATTIEFCRKRLLQLLSDTQSILAMLRQTQFG